MTTHIRLGAALMVVLLTCRGAVAPLPVAPPPLAASQLVSVHSTAEGSLCTQDQGGSYSLLIHRYLSQPVPAMIGEFLQHVDDLQFYSIQWMLAAERFVREREILVEMGQAPFRIYERILADQELDSQIVGRAFTVIKEVKANRSRFLEPTVRRLLDEKPGIRLGAVALLAEIGGDKEIPLVVALLSDVDFSIAYQAAITLKAIGNHRTVTAIDIWLNSPSHQDIRELRQHILWCRNELKARLDMPPVHPKAPPPRPVKKP